MENSISNMENVLYNISPAITKGMILLGLIIILTGIINYAYMLLKKKQGIKECVKKCICVSGTGMLISSTGFLFNYIIHFNTSFISEGFNIKTYIICVAISFVAVFTLSKEQKIHTRK